VARLGGATAEAARALTLAVYARAAAHAEARGIILADTKLELGVLDGQLVLADEVLTPDSSRFWPRNEWAPGRTPPSFDKQPVRDELAASGWDKRPPPPPLSEATVAATRARYIEGYERLSGRSFGDWPGP
jgi:phosphoribosylaminoimidazole-succinocarboxamide synthase